MPMARTRPPARFRRDPRPHFDLSAGWESQSSEVGGTRAEAADKDIDLLITNLDGSEIEQHNDDRNTRETDDQS